MRTCDYGHRWRNDNPEDQRNVHGYDISKIVDPEIIIDTSQTDLENPSAAPGKARIDRQAMNYLLESLDPTDKSSPDGRIECYLLAQNRHTNWRRGVLN